MNESAGLEKYFVLFKGGDRMNKLRKIGIALFMMELVLPSVIWGGLRALDYCGLNVMEAFETDTGEKREEAALPEEMLSFSIGAGIEKYYNDRIPFRATIINADKKLTSLVERPYNEYIENKYSATEPEEEVVIEEIQVADIDAEDTNGEGEETSFWDTAVEEQDVQSEQEIDEEQPVEIVEEDILEEDSEEPEEEEIIEAVIEENTSEIPLRVVNDKVVLGADGWLFYGESRCIENFRGTNLKNETELANYAQPFIALKTYCELKGGQFRAFVCPDKERIYTEHYPNVTKESEISLTEQVRDYITVNSSVQFLYPKNELRKYKNAYQLYYKHDSHWNAAGGFVGTRELLLSLGVPVQTIDNVYTAPVTISSGDLILLGGLSPEDYAEDTNYDIGYMNHVGVFSDDSFNSDRRMIDITSQSENHQYLVLVGDSCKMNMLQYLAVNYDHVTFIHKNAISDTASQEALRTADVIVLEIAERNVNEFSTVAWKVYEAVEDTMNTPAEEE